MSNTSLLLGFTVSGENNCPKTNTLTFTLKPHFCNTPLNNSHSQPEIENLGKWVWRLQCWGCCSLCPVARGMAVPVHPSSSFTPGAKCQQQCGSGLNLCSWTRFASLVIFSLLCPAHPWTCRYPAIAAGEFLWHILKDLFFIAACRPSSALSLWLLGRVSKDYHNQ